MNIHTHILLALTLLVGSFQAQATIAIPGSRVVYEDAHGEERMSLQQAGQTPGVVQIWLDDGNADALPENERAPFALTPVVARIDPGRRQLVQIQRIENLPDDRESLLWLNVLEIPLVSTWQEESAQQAWQPAAEGFRARVKFFYRPKGLVSSPAQAYQALRFSLGKTLPDGRIEVRVHNPTPYHVTFMDLALRETQESPALAEFDADRPEERMVVPMGELVLTLDRTALFAKDTPSLTGAAVTFSIINDNGGKTLGQQALDAGVAMQ